LGLKGYFAALRAAFDDLTITRGIIVVEGDHVACQTTIVGTFVREFTHSPVGSLPPNGNRVVFELMNIFRYDDAGRLAEEWIQTDNRSVLRQQDEHARIDPLLDAVEGAFADRDGGHQRLGDTVDALASALYGHLTHEERDVLPLIDQSLTQAEWRAFGNDQRRRTGIRSGAQLFPWLLDEATPEQVKAVLGELPPPLRVVYRRIWQPRYARHDHWEPSTQT